METLKAERVEFDSLKSLKAILTTQGPCLSAYMLLSTAPNHQGVKANALQWREILKSLEAKLGAHGATGRDLLESVSDWEALASEAPQGKSVAVFRSPEMCRLMWLDGTVENRATVGPHFYVRPLLPDLMREKTFYILALSQKNVRLLRATARGAEEVELPVGTATSYDAYMNTAKPDHDSQHGAATGPAGNGAKGLTTGTTQDRDNKDQYLAHFYKQIDHGLNECLRGKTAPVVLVGVEYEIAMYRTLNRYPHLAEASVEGAPNSLKSGELQARALDALLRSYDKKVGEQLAEYDHRVGGGASNRLREIIPAAHEGRVLNLLVSDSGEQTGTFDEATYALKGKPTGGAEDEDLVNDAVVQTILHAGQVFVAPHKKMPNGAPLAATFRF